MLAWPSNSCTARKSPLDSSRWLAKECRNICGCTGWPSPCARAHRPRCARREPRTQRLQRQAADRHDTHFAALAGDAHGAVTRQIIDIERDDFGETQSGRVEQLEQRAIAKSVSIGWRDIDETRGFVGA